MKFVKLNNDEWWEYDDTRNRFYNIRNGHTSARSEDIVQSIEVKDWHELYEKTGFNPLVDNNMWHCGWIAPNGDFYPCEAHELEAEYIYILIYGEEHGYYSDLLIERGWKKVTKSLMFDLYTGNGDYNNFCSKEQENTYWRWRNVYMKD